MGDAGRRAGVRAPLAAVARARAGVVPEAGRVARRGRCRRGAAAEDAAGTGLRLKKQPLFAQSRSPFGHSPRRHSRMTRLFLRPWSLLAILVMVNVAPHARASGIDPAGWRGDAKFLVSAVDSLHPRPYRWQRRAAWDSAAAELERRLPTLRYDQAVAGFSGLLGLLRDGHSRLDQVQLPSHGRPTLAPLPGPGFDTSYPVACEVFADGLWIAGAAAAGLRPAGRARARDRRRARGHRGGSARGLHSGGQRDVDPQRVAGVPALPGVPGRRGRGERSLLPASARRSWTHGAVGAWPRCCLRDRTRPRGGSRPMRTSASRCRSPGSCPARSRSPT